MKYVGNAYGYFSLPKEIQANHTKVMGSESKRLNMLAAVLGDDIELCY